MVELQVCTSFPREVKENCSRTNRIPQQQGMIHLFDFSPLGIEERGVASALGEGDWARCNIAAEGNKIYGVLIKRNSVYFGLICSEKSLVELLQRRLEYWETGEWVGVILMLLWILQRYGGRFESFMHFVVAGGDAKSLKQVTISEVVVYDLCRG